MHLVEKYFDLVQRLFNTHYPCHNSAGAILPYQLLARAFYFAQLFSGFASLFGPLASIFVNVTLIFGLLAIILSPLSPDLGLLPLLFGIHRVYLRHPYTTPSAPRLHNPFSTKEINIL